MNNMPLGVAANLNLDATAGQYPQLNQSIMGWLKPMSFILVQKYISNGVLVESGAASESWIAPDGKVITGQMIDFMGLMVPRYRRLEMKQEGERRWSNYDLAAHAQLELKADDCVIYGYGTTPVQYRVMEKVDGSSFGIVVYRLMEDYQLSGPLQLVAAPDGFGNQVPVLDASGKWTIE